MHVYKTTLNTIAGLFFFLLSTQFLTPKEALFWLPLEATICSCFKVGKSEGRMVRRVISVQVISGILSEAAMISRSDGFSLVVRRGYGVVVQAEQLRVPCHILEKIVDVVEQELDTLFVQWRVRQHATKLHE